MSVNNHDSETVHFFSCELTLVTPPFDPVAIEYCTEGRKICATLRRVQDEHLFDADC